MPPERLRLRPEERALRGQTRMADGSLGGRAEASSPVREKPSKESRALAFSSVGAGVGTLVWNSHPDEIPDGALSVPFYPTFDGEFTNLRATCGRSPSGGAATFDVTLNGVSILPALISIAASGTLSGDVTPTTAAFARDDIVQVVCVAANGVLDVIVYADYARAA